MKSLDRKLLTAARLIHAAVVNGQREPELILFDESAWSELQTLARKVYVSPDA